MIDLPSSRWPVTTRLSVNMSFSALPQRQRNSLQSSRSHALSPLPFGSPDSNSGFIGLLAGAPTAIVIASAQHDRRPLATEVSGLLEGVGNLEDAKIVAVA